MIWFSKDSDGRQHFYSVSAPLLAIVPLLAIAVGVLLAIIRGCAGP